MDFAFENAIVIDGQRIEWTDSMEAGSAEEATAKMQAWIQNRYSSWGELKVVQCELIGSSKTVRQRRRSYTERKNLTGKWR